MKTQNGFRFKTENDFIKNVIYIYIYINKKILYVISQFINLWILLKLYY